MGRNSGEDEGVQSSEHPEGGRMWTYDGRIKSDGTQDFETFRYDGGNNQTPTMTDRGRRQIENAAAASYEDTQPRRGLFGRKRG